MFFTTVALKNFAIFTGKHLYWSLFLIKLKAKAYKSIKKRLQHRYFPVNIRKCLRTAFFMEPFRWLLLKVMQRWHKKEYLLTKRSNQQNCFFTSLLKRNSNTGGLQLYQKKTPTQVFFCKYCEIFKNTYFEEQLRTFAFEWTL